MKMSYDAEADVLSLVFRDEQIVQARDENDIILNFGSTGEIVEIEILQASKILGQFITQLLQTRAGRTFTEIGTPS
ncbi:MAG: hypothetical protein RBG13Loki_1388 [Promethearchaeota archaeon CR_4]|nr:MAG: hypothetical protein RBG13Loki_1388 [Candidatus Lokiarchaeota archaeon CR_4]